MQVGTENDAHERCPKRTAPSADLQERCRAARRRPPWMVLAASLLIATTTMAAGEGSRSQCRRACRPDVSDCGPAAARCRAAAAAAFDEGEAACLSDLRTGASHAKPTSDLHAAQLACQRSYRSCRRLAIDDCMRAHRNGAVFSDVDSAKCPTTPAPACSELGPDQECRDPLDAADRLFWDTLHAGAYGGISDVLSRLDAALAACPGNPSLTRHVAWAHVWRVVESARGTATGAELGQSLLAVVPAFSVAWALETDDPRVLGFLGSVTFGQGFALGNAAQQAQGLAMLDQAAAAWPEFNYFTAGYATSTLPQASEGFQRALDYQWRTLDVCAGKAVDRHDPDLKGLARHETHVGRRRVCFNSWIAPFNWEGFFLNFGDMLVKNRDPDTAVRVYAAARLAGNYERWPYRSVLERRIENAEGNMAAFNREPAMGDDAIMLHSSFGCVGCHQAR